MIDDESDEYQHEVIIPIITQGDVIGAVVLLSAKAGDEMNEVEMKLAQSALLAVASSRRDNLISVCYQRQMARHL